MTTEQVHRLVARIWPKIKVHPLGCWEWQGHCQRSGHGVIKDRRDAAGRQKAFKVHRVVYTAEIGPIPAGLDLDHLCLNQRCVNPAHLDPVTRGENTRRAFAAGLFRRRDEANTTTHCVRGHERTAENTYVRSDGRGRICKDCDRENKRRYRGRT